MLLTYREKNYMCEAGETVLESLVRQGENVPSSCRNGVCQTCLMRAIKGTPPPQAQTGLKQTLREQGYFLACVCKPNNDMEVVLGGEDVATRTFAVVHTRTPLNADILCLKLRCHRPFAYFAGQFAHLIRQDGLVRSYSLATPPDEEGLIEFHIRKLQGGDMSSWVHDTLEVGDTVEVAGAFGNCFYLPDCPDQNLLLIGTGSGLAPLWGIVCDALAKGHTGKIHLYHGSWKPSGLYLTDELHKLSRTHSNFIYMPCVDEGASEAQRQGRADVLALNDLPNLKGWRVFLCGHPEMVKSAKKRTFLAGAASQDIYSDPFVLSKKI